MKSFDEANYNQRDCEVHNHAYYLGQQSKQAEIDELKCEMLNKINEAYADGQKSMRKMIKSNEDELREMVRMLVDNTIVAVDDSLENKANDLLRGNTDDH